ncbi:unnamed protein product [Adineta ricciae]|uniref:MICOS complex subunit n=1 Tax=Adineta ricciae TaxID=249248 RepID=A0A814J2X9_ADIRI|nr:unnamed protein product [Adineta ricciae]
MPKKSENDASPTQNSRIIRVRDLPIYYDPKTDDIYRYVPRIDNDQQKRINNTNRFQTSINQTRQSIQQFWNNSKELRLKISRKLEKGQTYAKATVNYIRDDQTFYPKISVVTIAGLGGLLLGQKRSVLRKTFYSSVAVAVALSACYPKQSVNLLNQVHNRIQNNSQKNNQSVIIKHNDGIVHTIKNEHEPVISVGDEYGRGTPAD